SLIITNCVVRNFNGSGIALAPSAASRITISNTLVAENSGHGIYLQPTGTDIGKVHAALNRVEVYHNGQMGFGVYGNLFVGQSFINAVVIDSVSGHNGGNGFYALSNGQNTHTTLRLFRSATIANSTPGVLADGNGTIVLSQSNVEDDGWG